MPDIGAWWSFSTAGRVLSGRGVAAAVGEAATGFGQRAYICSDRVLASVGIVAQIEESLRAAGIEVTVFDGGEPEVRRSVVERCAVQARDARPDMLVGLGGGSNLDLAKAAALLLSHGGTPDLYYGESKVPGPVLPIIAIPTTAGTGSEVTPVAVLADE